MMMPLATKRLSSAAAFLSAFLLVAVCSLSARAEPAYETWFTPSEQSLRAWNFVEVEDDDSQVLIRKKQPDVTGPVLPVMVIFPRPSSAYDIAMNKILDVFEEKEINAEFLLYNFGKDHGRGKRGLKIAEERGYRLVFSMGSETTAWLWDNYRGGEIPIVSVCSKDPVVLGQAPSYEVGTGSNFAFTSLNMPIEVQMAYVKELKPDLKNLGILVNSKNVSAVETQAKPMKRYAERLGIRVQELAVETPEGAAEELETLVAKAVAVMRKNDPTLSNSAFWITGSTVVFREIATINENADRVPVLSVVPDVVMPGPNSAVLSIGVSFESNAHLAAIYGADVLQERVEVGDLPVGIVSPPDIAINFLKAREIGLEVPFSFFESASFVYDYEGRIVRDNGKPVRSAPAGGKPVAAKPK
ncbi:MAG: ABC transporter substrate binding protein [Kiloniellales bacterium]|nr:ABC transporter substrate binding protein [Kiloniellales bacterium]